MTISYRSIALWTIGTVAAYVALYVLLPAVAHAGTDPTVAAPPLALDWPEYLAIGLAALAGVRVIVDALLAFFKMLAPRTKTTVDDTIRDDLQLAHDKLDAISNAVTRIAPPPRNPQAGRVRLPIVMIIALSGGVLALPAVMFACSATQVRQTAASGVVAALDCEAGNIDAQALADAKVYAEDTVQRWISGAGAKPSAEAIKAVLVRIKSDVGKCAIAGALAAATVVVTQQPGTVVSALSASDPVQLRAAFAVAARSAGWAPVKIQGGAVL